MKTFIAFFCILAAAVCGCRFVNEDPIFEVKESGLNWLEIHYFNYRRKPITRVKLHINGSGLIDVREGTSALVSNEFAANTKDVGWADIRQNRLTLDPAEVHLYFQQLVDAGLFKKRYKWSSNVHSNEAIFAFANINNKTTGNQDDIWTTDPDLAEHLKNIVLMFYHPSPSRKRKLR
ncbi:MAG: hypothetical protein J6Z49_08200 [Kiritimatiellae bacterium]|nr:hypothetical protein [Kiritimatiellia bacterium]